LIYLDFVNSPPAVTSSAVVDLALALGEVEEAIDLMELIVENRSWTQHWIGFWYRNNDAVKDHPRYLALLKRIGLDDESVAALHRKMSFD
jgi:hypothetical protein